MSRLIKYTEVESTWGLFAAHLFNAKVLCSDAKLIEQEALKRFGKKDEESTMKVFKEANETLTVARRHGLTCAEPIGKHKGQEYGVLRGQITFLKYFERDRSFT